MTSSWRAVRSSRSKCARQISDLLIPALEEAGALTLRESNSCLTVMNLSAEAIGELALEQQNALYELTDLCSLEDAFMELTEGAVQYRASL